MRNASFATLAPVLFEIDMEVSLVIVSCCLFSQCRNASPVGRVRMTTDGFGPQNISRADSGAQSRLQRLILGDTSGRAGAAPNGKGQQNVRRSTVRVPRRVAGLLLSTFADQGRCGRPRAGGLFAYAAGQRSGGDPQSRSLPIHRGRKSAQGERGGGPPPRARSGGRGGGADARTDVGTGI